MQLKCYPEDTRFKPVTLADREIIQPFMKAWQKEESHLAFSNLYMWQRCYHTSYAVIDDVLYLSLQFAKSRIMFFEPISMNPNADIKPMIHQIAEFYGERPQDFTLRSVSAEVRRRIAEVYGDAFEYRPDRRNFDYVYNTQDLIELKGSKYHGKRNHINKFMSQNAFEYKPYGPEYRDGCWELYQRWYEAREGAENPEDEETLAMRLALDDAEALGFKGGVILINGQIEAFTLGERITDKMVVIHVEKANSSIQGLYPAINQLFLQSEWSDTEFVNREEDMGIPGLRKAKQSYHPSRMLEKFIITANPQTCKGL